MATKIQKTAVELEAMINAELARHPECHGMSASVRPSDANGWEIGAIRISGTSAAAGYQEQVIAIRDRLRAQYDLASGQ